MYEKKLKRWTKLSGLLLLILCGAILYDMKLMAEAQELWGYRPLFMYLSGYGGLVLLLYRFDYPKPPPPEDREAVPEASQYVNRTKALLWSTSSGVLLGLGFPGYLPFPFLLLVAFVPLLLLHREQCLSGAAAGKVFFHGLHAFLIYNMLATYWVTNTAFAPGVFAVIANSLLMCIPWMLFHWTSRRSSRLAFWAFPAYWITFEWGHHNWDLNWPWLTIGNGFAEFPAFIQWYSITGALGGGLWVLLVNQIIFSQLGSRWTDGLWTSPAGSPFHATGYDGKGWNLLAILIIALPPVFSVYSFLTPKVAEGARISIVSIQPNFEPHFEKFTISSRATLDTFVALSREALAAHPDVDYLLFPETSLDRMEEDDLLGGNDLRYFADRLGDNKPKYLVSGYDGFHRFSPGEPRTKATRSTTDRNGQAVDYEVINAALQLDFDQQLTQSYRKGVFVPGAESFPFRDFLGFLLPLVEAAGGSVAGRGTQAKRAVFTGQRASVAPVICYESVFGEYFTGYVKAGAQVAFVLTNDGWWDNTSGHLQHLYISSLRAIETRRPVVRSANVGACAFIAANGSIQQRTEYDQAGYLYGEVTLGEGQTIYVRYGDYIPLILGIGSILLLLMTLYGSWKQWRGHSNRVYDSSE